MSNINANTDYASGAAKETAGNVTGSDQLKAKGQAQKNEGNINYEQQPITQTDEDKGPSKVSGQYHASKGAAKEALGAILKNESLEQSGAQERRAGNQAIEASKAQNVAEGAAGQVKGTVKQGVGHITGDPQKEVEGKEENTQGQIQRNANQ